MVTVLVSFHLAGGCVGGVDHNRLLLGLGLRENGKTYNGEYTTAQQYATAVSRTMVVHGAAACSGSLLTRSWLRVLRGNGEDTMQCC